MSFVSPTVAVALVTVVLFFAVLKLVKWSINADELQVGQGYVMHLTKLYRMVLLVIVLLTFGSGIAAWLYDAWHYLHGLI